MNKLSHLTLKKKYIVETKRYIYKGTYVDYIMDDGYITYYFLDNVTKKDKTSCATLKPEYLTHQVYFCPTNTFYDLEEIREKGQKARQHMEQRSLDMILKRLVNEQFQW